MNPELEEFVREGKRELQALSDALDKITGTTYAERMLRSHEQTIATPNWPVAVVTTLEVCQWR